MSSSEHASMLSSGISAQMHISYGIAAVKGRRPAQADGVAAVPSFTRISPTMGLDYYGVFDGFFGACFAHHFAELLHIGIAKGVEDELVADAPRFLERWFLGRPDEVEVWWRKLVMDAFRIVDDELVARFRTGVPGGSPAVAAMVMKDRLVIASRGAICRAVIYRDEEAVQLTSEPHKQKEEKNIQNAGGDVVGSSCNLEHDKATARPILFRPYFPKPEVLMVEREPRDKFLILATSGLWGHVTPAEAGIFIQTKLHTNSPAILAKELAELAMRRGSMVNVAVLITLLNNF